MGSCQGMNGAPPVSTLSILFTLSLLVVTKIPCNTTMDNFLCEVTRPAHKLRAANTKSIYGRILIRLPQCLSHGPLSKYFFFTPSVILLLPIFLLTRRAFLLLKVHCWYIPTQYLIYPICTLPDHSFFILFFFPWQCNSLPVLPFSALTIWPFLCT